MGALKKFIGVFAKTPPFLLKERRLCKSAGSKALKRVPYRRFLENQEKIGAPKAPGPKPRG
jgi:hypothetical protein